MTATARRLDLTDPRTVTGSPAGRALRQAAPGPALPGRPGGARSHRRGAGPGRRRHRLGDRAGDRRAHRRAGPPGRAGGRGRPRPGLHPGRPGHPARPRQRRAGRGATRSAPTPPASAFPTTTWPPATSPTTSPGPCSGTSSRRPRPPRRAVFLVQREVAARIAAPPGGWSLATVAVRSVADVERLRDVPATSFLPAPAVASSIIRMHPARRMDEEERREVLRLARAAFQLRRKTLRHGLGRALGERAELVEAVLARCGVDPGAPAGDPGPRRMAMPRPGGRGDGVSDGPAPPPPPDHAQPLHAVRPAVPPHPDDAAGFARVLRRRRLPLPLGGPVRQPARPELHPVRPPRRRLRPDRPDHRGGGGRGRLHLPRGAALRPRRGVRRPPRQALADDAHQPAPGGACWC